MNLRALTLALFALSSIGALVFILVQDVRAQTAWNDLVHETIPQVVAAQESVDAAEDLLEGAGVAGVPSADTVELSGLVESSQLLLEQLGEIALYVMPDTEGEVDALTRQEVEASPLAALDLYAESQKSQRLQIETPSNASEEIKRFSALSTALDDVLSSLDTAVKEVQDLVSQHLDTAKQALATAQDSLRYEIVRGYVLDEFARSRNGDETARMKLTDALQSGQQVLLGQQGMDKTDAAVVAASVVEANQAIADIKEAATALLESLGVGEEEVMELLDPEQVWAEQEPWLPEPVPVSPTPQAPTPVVPDRPTGGDTEEVTPPDEGGGTEVPPENEEGPGEPDLPSGPVEG